MTLIEIQQLYAACTARPEVFTPEYSAMRQAQEKMEARCIGIVGTLLDEIRRAQCKA